MCGETWNSAENELKVCQMENYLDSCQRQGIGVYMDDREVKPAYAAERAVREDSSYMADFVCDEEGRIVQIRFDRVKNK